MDRISNFQKEDDAITQLVRKYGDKNWTLIANKLIDEFKIKHRNGKQCRERWHNHLDPKVVKEGFTKEEEKLLFDHHDIYGNKWSEISKKLNGRSENLIKNYYYSTLRRQVRRISKLCKKQIKGMFKSR